MRIKSDYLIIKNMVAYSISEDWFY